MTSLTYLPLAAISRIPKPSGPSFEGQIPRLTKPRRPHSAACQRNQLQSTSLSAGRTCYGLPTHAGLEYAPINLNLINVISSGSLHNDCMYRRGFVVVSCPAHQPVPYHKPVMASNYLDRGVRNASVPSAAVLFDFWPIYAHVGYF